MGLEDAYENSIESPSWMLGTYMGNPGIIKYMQLSE